MEEVTSGMRGTTIDDKISVEIPPFWAPDPELWFVLVEARFKVAGITADDTKFNQIISQLESAVAMEVADVIIKPPLEGKYETLKSELISRLSSTTKNLMRRLEQEEMDDRTPSQFMRHLRDLSRNTLSEEYLRMLWQDRLPTNIQAILAPLKSPPFEEVAAVADKLYDFAPQGAVKATQAHLATEAMQSDRPNQAAYAYRTKEDRAAGISNNQFHALEKNIEYLHSRIDDLQRIYLMDHSPAQQESTPCQRQCLNSCSQVQDCLGLSHKKCEGSDKKKPTSIWTNGSTNYKESASKDDACDKESSPRKTEVIPKQAGNLWKNSSDSDVDWGIDKKASSGTAKCLYGVGDGGGLKRKGGYSYAYTLSPELAAVVGAKEMARYEVIQKINSIIQEKDLYDPKNKAFAICDDQLLKVIMVKRFRNHGVMKYLRHHFIE